MLRVYENEVTWEQGYCHLASFPGLIDERREKAV